MNIDFFACAREYKEYKKDYNKIFNEVYSSGQVLQGKTVIDFEKDVAKFCGRSFAVSVNSCTDALFFALRASGIGNDDEVLVTDLSFVASASSILRTGAKPVFVDIDCKNAHMDLNKASKKINNKTKAIVYVQLYGEMISHDVINNFAKEHNLILIEDAAQSFGAEYKNIKSGKIGLCSCFSFDPTKILRAPGSGGMVLTDDNKIYNNLKSLRYHGKSVNNDFNILGFNSQMPSITAALLSYSFKNNLNRHFLRRKEIAKKYSKYFKKAKIVQNIKDNKQNVFHKMVFYVEKDRDEIVKYLKTKGIPAKIHYEYPLHKYSVFNDYDYNDKDFEVVNDFTKHVLSLPIHAFITEEEVEYMASVLENI